MLIETLEIKQGTYYSHFILLFIYFYDSHFIGEKTEAQQIKLSVEGRVFHPERTIEILSRAFKDTDDRPGPTQTN